jgi:diguanylate cyclase (GGDEF)-like protein
MRHLRTGAKKRYSSQIEDESQRAESPDEVRLAARALAYLFLSGATIGLLSLLLPHPPKADVAGLYSNVALAYAGGIGLLASVSRIRPWMLQVALGAGSLLITRAVLLSGVNVSFYTVWFIWVGLYAFFFFTRAVAAGHVAFVSVLYGATLVDDTPSSPVARWLTTVATLIVAGVFIDMLVRRARRQATVAAESAEAMAQVTELAHGLAALSDAGAARKALCEGAQLVSRAARVALWEPDAERPGLQLTATVGEDRDQAQVARPPAGVAQAFAAGYPVGEQPAPHRGSWARVSGDDGTGGATLSQPVVRERLTVGVLEFHWEDPTTLREPSITALADLLAVEAAVTLQRVALLAELEAIARTDELTGLPNRRAWQEQLPLELTRADRSQTPLSVAMLDLDHFKRYNDSQGHQRGDGLLKQVAGAWGFELRPTDVLSRYGGEEFALALPECPLEEAVEVVERLRTAIPDGQTCSAGIASWDGSETAAELLGRADNELYRAKRSGRNQSAVATTPAAGTPIT